MMQLAIAKPKKKRWSRQDIINDPSGPERYEVIEGELYLPPTPKFAHQNIALRLARILQEYTDANDLGVVAIAPLDVIINQDESLQPDILYVSKERLDIVKDYIEGPPDLVVEIASPSTSGRDRVVKSRVYARFGVPHYWIIDPSDKTVLAYQLSDKNYALIGTAVGEEVFTSPLFPELKIELKKIWD